MMTVKIKQPTRQGYVECCVPGVADLSFPKSKTRRGRVQGGGEYVLPSQRRTKQYMYLNQ